MEIAEVGPQQWPLEYRHTVQDFILPDKTDPEFGDVIVVDFLRPRLNRSFPQHTAFFIADNEQVDEEPGGDYDNSRTVLHVDGLNGVAEGGVRGIVQRMRVVDNNALQEIANGLSGLSSAES